jgi:uroporphyrinogen decarboxylase
VPIALIVDSPWLPGYAGIDTLDYFLRGDEWLRINLGLIERFPEVAWIPGFWVEYGMANEPSAFGARVTWEHDAPPSIEAAPVDSSRAARLADPESMD